MFHPKGKFAGMSVDNVAADLKSGTINPADVEINYIVRNGQTIILNTRSAQSLEAAVSRVHSGTGSIGPVVSCLKTCSMGRSVVTVVPHSILSAVQVLNDAKDQGSGAAITIVGDHSWPEFAH
jgi:PPE-repeat protein